MIKSNHSAIPPEATTPNFVALITLSNGFAWLLSFTRHRSPASGNIQAASCASIMRSRALEQTADRELSCARCIFYHCERERMRFTSSLFCSLHILPALSI